eukprot:NODE_8548_length_220_cov_2.988304_g8465_i0.p2 GENE.NODE_8548_length_220_cov_2.988304_g8465_i0~~NODE_8548_length_220_cov_2.988304_g8465_i0.p2  ORF type:complete len:50 (+),score=22.53 NODE_8548_length_220_cov_2.988304_g8465_i0:33-152(+)
MALLFSSWFDCCRPNTTHMQTNQKQKKNKEKGIQILMNE